jgi:hypothetical protein
VAADNPRCTTHFREDTPATIRAPPPGKNTVATLRLQGAALVEVHLDVNLKGPPRRRPFVLETKMANVLVLYRTNPTHHEEVVSRGADAALVRQSAPWVRRGRAPGCDSALGVLDEGCRRIPADLVEEGGGQ